MTDKVIFKNNKDTITRVDEVAQAKGFVVNLEFESNQFESVVANYSVEKDLKCCILREGRVCNTKHRRGYLVSLQDSRVTLVGSECINKLANDSKVIVGIRKFNVEKEKQTRRSKVEERLRGDLAADSRVKDAREENKKIISFQKQFLSVLPKTARTRIINMRRRGVGEIQAYPVKNGKIDKSGGRFFVASIQGISIFFEDEIKRINRRLSESLQWRMKMNEGNGKFSDKDVLNAYRATQNDETYINRSKELHKDFSAFKENYIADFAFLATERKSQFKLMAGVSQVLEVDRSFALDSLTKKIADICKEHDCEDFEVL